MSEKPVVLVTRKLPEAVEARLARDYRARFNEEDRLYSTDELLALTEGADGILPCHTEHLSAEVIARLPDGVRVVANMSVGVDHVDLNAAKGRGIVVTNTPDVLSDATAEIAMLLMLGAARRASEGERLVRAREWRDWSPAFMVGTQVTGKRLIYHEHVEDLLPHCDVLSLHCPATPDSRNLLNAERIALLPDGAIVVNTARGAIVDDEALIAALRSGKLAAAGLDVFNNEPYIHPGYRDLPNTFLLPHIGSATRETRDAMGFRACDNLDAFFAGREPGDRVA
jgi:lactate dehydrogenase-like 2-hydroxyacid dehydrogenase